MSELTAESQAPSIDLLISARAAGEVPHANHIIFVPVALSLLIPVRHGGAGAAAAAARTAGIRHAARRRLRSPGRSRGREPVTPTDAPPVAAVVWRGRSACDGVGGPVRGTLRLDGETFARGHVKVPLVTGATLLEARADGRPLPLMQEGDAHAAILPGPVSLLGHARWAVPLRRPQGARRSCCRCRPAAPAAQPRSAGRPCGRACRAGADHPATDERRPDDPGRDARAGQRAQVSWSVRETTPEPAGRDADARGREVARHDRGRRGPSRRRSSTSRSCAVSRVLRRPSAAGIRGRVGLRAARSNQRGARGRGDVHRARPVAPAAPVSDQPRADPRGRHRSRSTRRFRLSRRRNARR